MNLLGQEEIMGISNYQLVLLDNFIYLNTILDIDQKDVGDVINTLL